MINSFSLKLKFVLCAVLLCISLGEVHSQQVLVVSGGNMASTTGSVSYSVGQIFNNNIVSTDGSAIQGIQFYFENITLKVIDIKTNFNITTYPNPTSSFINIKINDYNKENLSYELYDLLGKVLIKKRITSDFTKINIKDLPNAVYLLKLSNSSNENIKTLKIIKK